MNLDAEQTPSKTLPILGIVALAIVMILGCVFCALPLLLPRQEPGVAPVIGNLKAIANGQTLYREGDKDGDGTLQYAASLTALTNTGPGGDEDLIDEVLASGTKQGYVFSITSASESGYTVNASPQEDGQRHFGTNMRGELYSSSRGPVIWNPDGSSPDQALGGY